MTILTIVQIILSILLIVAILLQQRGSGLGATFGGDNSIVRSKEALKRVFSDNYCACCAVYWFDCRWTTHISCETRSPE